MNQTNIEVCNEKIVNLELVGKIRSDMPPEAEINSLSETFKVLGDPTRLQIVLALAKAELCVCDLATLINLSVSAISHQLRLLRGMKLVKFRREGKMVYYSLDDDHIEHIIGEARTHVQEE